jgi:hypothetical protein
MNSDGVSIKKQKQKQKQNQISLGRFCEARFLICNWCFWCSSLLSDNYFDKCPTCKSENIEIIPIAQTE